MEIRDLSVSVDSQPVVKQLTLSINSGEFHLLLGPNGAGKSSLGLAIAGHPDYQITRGKVLLDGQNILDLSAEARSRLGFFLQFQTPIAVPGVTIQSFLREIYLSRFGHGAKKTLSALDFFQHLTELVTQVDLPAKILTRGLNDGLSGGERKKLEMLQLLVLQPKFAVLDELDSGLDISSIKLMAQLIKKILTKSATGILLISHTSRLTKLLKPNFVHILKEGRLIRSGGAELLAQVERAGY